MARRFVRRNAGSGRLTRWIGLTPFADSLDGNGTVLVSVGNAAFLELRPLTIIRTHLFWSFGSDQTIASEFMACALGMAIVSDTAAVAGVASLPTPITDQGSDKWWIWDFATGQYEFQSAVGTNPNFDSMSYRIDSKAMRKVNDGENFVTVLEAPSISNGLTVTTAGRMLIKLH